MSTVIRLPNGKLAHSVAGGAVPLGYDYQGQHISGQQMLQDAAQRNGGQMGDWYIDPRGQIVDANGRAVPLTGHLPGDYDLSFGQELLHATPYIAGAFGMGALGALGGGAAGAAEAGGAGTGMTVTELGSPLAIGSTSAGSLGGAVSAGAGAAGAAGGAAGGVAGGAAGASGGGSTFGQILNTAGKFGNALQGYEQGRQQGRVADALLQQRQDQNAMEAARLNLQAPADRASNAVQGDILSNAQDFHFNPGFGTGSTGGLRPSIFSPQTRQLGALQSAQALAGAQKNNGNVFTPTPLPQPSSLDSILNTAAPIGNLLSLIPYKGSSDWYGGS